MTRKVRGRKEKHHCEMCGNLLYDLIPKESTITFMGMPVPEYGRKSYQKFKYCLGKEYCEECYSKR